MKKVVVFILLLSCVDFLYSDENRRRFSGISWETSPEQFIIKEGLPDTIFYSYDFENAPVHYCCYGYEIRTVVALVWVNDSINDNDLIKHAKENNIPIGYNITSIINGHDNIWFRFNNIQYLDFTSTVFLTFSEGKLINISYQIEITNLTNNEKQDISLVLQNYLTQYYGTPYFLFQEGVVNFLRWQVNNTNIELNIILHNIDPIYSEFNYPSDNIEPAVGIPVDFITITYRYFN